MAATPTPATSAPSSAEPRSTTRVLVVIVTVDEPTQGGSDYGGMVAAPAAADIVSDLLKYMQVP